MQFIRNSTITTGASSVQVLDENIHRIAYSITALTSAASVCKGVAAAVANTGIVLQPNSTLTESDTENFMCWRGAIQVIAAAAGTVAISEVIDMER